MDDKMFNPCFRDMKNELYHIAKTCEESEEKKKSEQKRKRKYTKTKRDMKKVQFWLQNNQRFKKNVDDVPMDPEPTKMYGNQEEVESEYHPPDPIIEKSSDESKAAGYVPDNEEENWEKVAGDVFKIAISQRNSHTRRIKKKNGKAISKQGKTEFKVGPFPCLS